MPDSLLSQLRHLIQQAPRVPGVPRELRPTAPVFRQESGGFHPLQVCPEHLPASRPRAAASSSSRAQPEPHSGYLRAWSSRQNRSPRSRARGMNREGASGKSPDEVYIQQKVRVLLMLRKMGSNLTASEEEFLRTYAGVVSSQLSQLPQHAIDQATLVPHLQVRRTW
ncbi:beta-catenin-interacting protein 1 isoform X4 [Cavia porcellus]|uniref:beta-catenin-interacting protein 1 isoform X4 n=1 Tax=Cavia porcellus TaxID=10141 RepID=UPI002FE02CE0